MVELLCRNEPRHFFCLYNVLKIFGKTKKDVQSVYKALKVDKKCIAFRSNFCPVTEHNRPCALLRRSHDSIIREQLYALEGLNFIHRERDSRKLLFRITKLGRKATQHLPVLLPPNRIEDGKEVDLNKKSSKKWIECCKKGLTSYGPFVGYLWKLKCGKAIDEIKSEIGDRAVNAFNQWAEECSFKAGNTVKTPEKFFVQEVRIRNWVTKKFKNEPPPNQKDTAKILFRLKHAKLIDGIVEVRNTLSRKMESVLLNIENSGIIIEKADQNRIFMKNDFDLHEYSSSIKDREFLNRLYSSIDMTKRELMEEEIAFEKLKSSLETEKNERKAVLDFIRKRSKENSRKTPVASKLKGKRLKRDYELYVYMKKLHHFKCQVKGCNFTFRKKNREYYCEIAHIKSFSSSKDDTADNILVLCANCHKMLDYGDEKIRKAILEKAEPSRQALLKILPV